MMSQSQPQPIADAAAPASTDAIAADGPIVLFDGVSNFCHGAVQFIIARDPRERFRFASLQSELGQRICEEHGQPADVTTMMMLEPDGQLYARTTAALRVARELSGLWPLCAVALLIPPFLRDPLYEWFASNRYRWFGQKDSCPLPDPALAHRFLG